MTEIIASESSHRLLRSLTAARRDAGQERGEATVHTRLFALWAWFPREIVHRGGAVTREHERAYRDLQAARDRSEW